MSPRSTVHYSKKEAIFQLCNFICSSSVSKITDLADGDILQKTIQTKFPEFSKDAVNSENVLFNYPDKLNLLKEDESKHEDDCPDKLNSVKEDKSKQEDCPDKLNCVEEDKTKVENEGDIKKSRKRVMKNKKESNFINVGNKTPEVESIIPITLVKSNESHPAKNEDILLRFNYIQKFIDDRYQIKSEDIISYSKCTKSCELELTKVSIFVLSEIVKYLLEANNEDLQTLFHLDVKYQVELEECFKLFISEREKITKAEVEKLLFKSARNASPLLTPRRTSSRHSERKSVSPPKTKEDIYSNSPLKMYFESPIFKKEDIFMKDMQIVNLKKILDDEEEESIKRHCRLSEMEKELEKKDQDYKQLKNKMTEMENEIQFLQNSCQSDSCKAEKQKLSTDCNTAKRNVAVLENEVVELRTEIAYLHKILDEKENLEKLKGMKSEKFSPKDESSVLMTARKKIKAFEAEIGMLREKIKSLEMKNHVYKQQLSEIILTELKEKKSPGNLNRSYEEKWEELDRERKEKEENIGRLIEEDNKLLWARLNEANLKNKKLLEEIDVLKKQATNKNKKLDHQKEVCSVATMTVGELINTSKITEIEKLRNSLNHSKDTEHCHLSNEPSYILNNSDNHIACEASVSSESVIPCPGKSSEAVLWKMYDSEKSEIENTCGISLGHDSVVSENIHLDLKNDLGMNSDKIDNTETDILLGHENKYVLGNLNFDVFLNELKKLTKNGSFQKVLQVFGKCQKEINGTNKSNRLDLQEMLKMITECVCVAVALNAESSFANLQEKSSFTDEKDSRNVNQKNLVNKLKKELSTISQKHEIELKECKKELEKLKGEISFYELKCEAYSKTLDERIGMFNELHSSFIELKLNFDQKVKKCIEMREASKRLLDSKRKLENEFLQLKSTAHSLNRKKCAVENIAKKLHVENGFLKKQMRKFKENNISEVNSIEVKERKKSDFQLPSRDSCIGIPNHCNVKSELQSSFWQDTANESVLSGALHKNLSHYVSENEEDFCYYNSLDVIKNDDKGDRVEELKRRNSLLPLHLQSAYPVEANLRTAYESLYVKDDEKSKEENCCKKRKLSDTEFEKPSSYVAETPVRKAKKKFKTPPSLRKLLQIKPRLASFTSKH